MTENKIPISQAPEEIQASYAAGQQLLDHDRAIVKRKGKLKSYDEALRYQRIKKDREVKVNELRAKIGVEG